MSVALIARNTRVRAAKQLGVTRSSARSAATLTNAIHNVILTGTVTALISGYVGRHRDAN